MRHIEQIRSGDELESGKKAEGEMQRVLYDFASGNFQ